MLSIATKAIDRMVASAIARPAGKPGTKEELDDAGMGGLFEVTAVSWYVENSMQRLDLTTGAVPAAKRYFRDAVLAIDVALVILGKFM
jgi:hypothetical protein